MRKQFFHPLIFLLSVIVHLSLAFAIGPRTKILDDHGLSRQPVSIIAAGLKSSESATKSEAPSFAKQKSIDTVQNVSQTSTQLADQEESTSNPIGSSAALPPQTIQEQHEETSYLPILTPVEPRYFQSYELTEDPVVLQDVASDAVLALPDTSPHVARVSLLINERGEVDQVMIDEEILSEQVKHLISDVFSRMVFHPGKQGDLSVKSQLDIEIMLEQVIAPLPNTRIVH